MTYVKTYLPTLKMHVVNLKREAKDLSRDLQRLEVRGKLGSKTLYWLGVLSPPLPQTSRGQQRKRERLGTRLGLTLFEEKILQRNETGKIYHAENN